jgi:ubiquinone/menaquinone biosynthesis C-methylase UbiE
MQFSLWRYQYSSERKEAFEEFNRVVKVGGRVVVGDESVAPWLRDQSSYQTLMSANPMFADQVPLKTFLKILIILSYIGYLVLDTTYWRLRKQTKLRSKCKSSNSKERF